MKSSTFLISAILFVAAVVTAKADPILSLQPSAISVTSGSKFSLDLNIADVTALFAIQFDLGFAPGVLSATSITEGLFLPAGGTTFFIPGTIDNVAGAITATADTLIGAV